MLFKAAILKKLGEPLEIITLQNSAVKDGQILVKVLFSGVCRSQLMEVRGGRGHDPWLPHLLGHEGSGIVVEVGPGVKKVQPGDGVVLTWLKGGGLEAPGAQYHFNKQTINTYVECISICNSTRHRSLLDLDGLDGTESIGRIWMLTYLFAM